MRPIPKIMPIFGIGRLKTAATNNLLLVSTDKATIINIGHCYQPIQVIDPKVLQ
jgi:hypothetical protein